MLGNTPVGDTIQHMWDQEKVHLATFNSLIPQHRARPTILLPFWHLAGYALGAGTALLGKEGAMACTVAVEVNTSVVHHHWSRLNDTCLTCTKRSYYRRPYAIKNQRGASKKPLVGGFGCNKLVLYGIRDPIATPRKSPRHGDGPHW